MADQAITKTDYIIGGTLVVGLIVALIVRNNKKKQQAAIYEGDAAEAQAQSGGIVTIQLNGNLLLKKGSTGNEVKKLQQLLGISADGVFGSQTEAALKAKKGVIQITLNQFNSTPTVNNSPLKVGDRVMGNVKPSAPVLKALQKADGTFYTNNESAGTVGYGEELGKIIGIDTQSKSWYVIERSGLFSGLFGSKVFVNAANVKKI